MSVGGIVLVVLSVLVLCVFGGIAVSSMIVSVKEPQQGMADRLCAEPGPAGAVDGLCPAGSDAGAAEGLTLPVETFPAGPELASAYLDRYLRLLTIDQPGPRVDEINFEGLAADRFVTLNEKVYECDAGADLEIRAGATRMIELNDKHALLTVRVVETAPACVTETKAVRGALVRGTTDLELNFVPRPGPDGRPNWLLTDMHADPVTPDPLGSAAPRKGDPITRTDYKGLFTTIAT